MTARARGIVATVLIGIAVALAATVLFGVAPGLGAGYLTLCALGLGGIIYAFCAKCSCKERCGHVVPGWIARRLPREPGPYTSTENAVVILGLALIVGFPLFWLRRVVWALVIFVVLNAAAVYQLLRFVCRACDNVHCPVKAGGGR